MFFYKTDDELAAEAAAFAALPPDVQAAIPVDYRPGYHPGDEFVDNRFVLVRVDGNETPGAYDGDVTEVRLLP